MQTELLHKAIRATIVMPVAFAFCLLVLDNPTMAPFAAFGSFSSCVFADFGGPLRERLQAYGLLLLVTSLLVVAGTLLSDMPYVAAAVMVAVGFAATGVALFGGYFAAASTTVILAFVLPATTPAPAGAIPGRLAGWVLGVGLAAAASTLMWPTRRGSASVHRAADACDALADVVAAGSQATPELVATAQATVRAARGSFAQQPARRLGPSRRDLAFVYLLADLERFLLLEEAPREPGQGGVDDTDLRATLASALREAAAALRGQGGRPGLAAVRRANAAHRQAAIWDVEARLRRGEAPVRVLAAADGSFRTRVLATVSQTAVGHVRVFLGATVDTGADDVVTDAWPGFWQRAASLARSHMRPGSVGFANAARSGLALGLAVLVATLGARAGNVQHAFWIALGTLSVLRSDALGTGRSAMQAVAGTVAGFVVAVPVILLVGSNDEVLWVLLPITVFLAAYAPTALNYVVGQAAFTVLVVVLYNLVVPAGPAVAEARVIDVAIGALVGVLVGVSVWPRGAHGEVRKAIAAQNRAAAAYLLAAVGAVTATAGEPTEAARAAYVGARRRADVAVATAMGERPGRRGGLPDMERRLATSTPVRVASDLICALADHGFARSGCAGSSGPLLQAALRCGAEIRTIADRVVGRDGAAGVPDMADLDAAVVGCLAEVQAAGGGDARPALGMVWTRNWLTRLDHFLSLELAAFPGQAPHHEVEVQP